MDVCGLGARAETATFGGSKTRDALNKLLVDWGPVGLDLIETKLGADASAGASHLRLADHLIEHVDLRRIVAWGRREIDWNCMGGGTSITASTPAGPVTAHNKVAGRTAAGPRRRLEAPCRPPAP